MAGSMAAGRVFAALCLLIYFSSLSPSSTNISTRKLPWVCNLNLKLHCRRACSLKHEIIKQTKHGSCVVSLPFDAQVIISAYFAICCDVHCNPEPDSFTSQHTLQRYTREQLLGLRTLNTDGSGVIDNLRFHGLLRSSDHVYTSYYSGDLMDLFIGAYNNISTTFCNQVPDLTDLFICAYNNIQRSHPNNYSRTEMLNMNTNVAQDYGRHLIPVRITHRASRQSSINPSTDNYRSRTLVPIEAKRNSGTKSITHDVF